MSALVYLYVWGALAMGPFATYADCEHARQYHIWALAVAQLPVGAVGACQGKERGR